MSCDIFGVHNALKICYWKELGTWRTACIIYYYYTCAPWQVLWKLLMHGLYGQMGLQLNSWYRITQMYDWGRAPHTRGTGSGFNYMYIYF
jgi:hypothetical protein